MAGPLRGGGGLKGRPLRKKKISGYFMTKKRRRIKSSIAIKPEGWGGGKALMAQPLREEFFYRLPLCKNKFMS